jgi:hypothetical protein
MNGIKVVDELSICQVGSVHFWHRIHPNYLRICKKWSEVSMRSKVRGFDGNLETPFFLNGGVQYWIKLKAGTYRESL